MAELSAPRFATVKRLYALSGNRCAFPNCKVPVFQGTTLLGKMCHIKGAKPGAKRYDAMQSDEDRHGFGNLIVLCSNHHDVIDDDEISYTVERLHQMKAAHVESSGERPDDEVERVAVLLIAGTITMQNVATNNQSGGIAANVVNLNLSHDGSNARRAEAIETLWKIMLDMETEFTDLTLTEIIMTRDEINKRFDSDQWGGSFTSLNDYRNDEVIMHKMKRAGAWRAEELQIRVSDGVWSAFATKRAMLGRLGTLYNFSFEKRGYQDWRTDDLFSAHAIGLLGRGIFEEAARLPLQGTQHLLNYVQLKFRQAAGAL